MADKKHKAKRGVPNTGAEGNANAAALLIAAAGASYVVARRRKD